MRKRSKYRPKPIRTDAVAYVINGFLPLREAKNEIMRLQGINHSAMVAITSGCGTRDDAISLAHAFITTASLAEIGTGNDWLVEIDQASQAVNALLLRGFDTGIHVFTDPELEAANLAMHIHDLQMADCTIEKFERAITRASRAMSCGHQRKGSLQAAKP